MAPAPVQKVPRPMIKPTAPLVQKKSTVSMPQATEAPVETGNALNGPLIEPSKPPPKMVIHVPKSLFKDYKAGKITLSELTVKAKKV